MNSVKFYQIFKILALGCLASETVGRKFHISRESLKGNSGPNFKFPDKDHMGRNNSPVDTDPDKFKFFLYNNVSNTRQYEELIYKNGSVETSSFIRGVPLIVLNHGFLSRHNSSDDSTFPQNVKNGYLGEKNGTIQRNILITDWSSLSTPEPYYFGAYYTAATNVHVVGKRLAQILDYFIRQDYVKLSDIHIVGHSLGAHASGSTGRFLLEERGNKVGRITGLDPAGPLFYTGIATPMSKDDGKFVDVIHTNTGILGMAAQIGHVDFYPDIDGLDDKDCEDLEKTLNKLVAGDDACSHSIAHKIFVKSIEDNSIVACKCDVLSWFFNWCPTAPECNGNGTISAIFGEHVQLNTTEGEYFFDASKYPNLL